MTLKRAARAFSETEGETSTAGSDGNGKNLFKDVSQFQYKMVCFVQYVTLFM